MRKNVCMGQLNRIKMCAINANDLQTLGLFLSEDNILKAKLLLEKIKKEQNNSELKKCKEDDESGTEGSSSEEGISAFLANVSEEDRFDNDEFQKVIISKVKLMSDMMS
jgi:hypothetical protein